MLKTIVDKRIKIIIIIVIKTIILPWILCGGAPSAILAMMMVFKELGDWCTIHVYKVRQASPISSFLVWIQQRVFFLYFQAFWAWINWLLAIVITATDTQTLVTDIGQVNRLLSQFHDGHLSIERELVWLPLGSTILNRLKSGCQLNSWYCYGELSLDKKVYNGQIHL